ncbi:hypothetical protein AB4520_00880 [Vibrio renipiscarius]|uniref:hypothetical protein n=1 Tax=Vibrio renipiscarius TaxID=1461322 RepID=UPI00354DD130
MLNQQTTNDSLDVDISHFAPDADTHVRAINTVLSRNADEVHCLILEAQTTADEIAQIIQTYYEAPRKKINEAIARQNRIYMRNHFEGMGKMMIEMKCVQRTQKSTWPSAMLYELVFRDYNRTSKGTVKYYKNRSERHSNTFFHWHCTYGRRSRKDTDNVVRKVTELSPIQITTQHWQKSLIKRRAKPFEYQLFLQLNEYISLYTQRYFLIVERYKRLRQERTEALRKLCITLQLPVERINNCGVSNLVECIETHIHDYQIKLFSERY